MARGLSDVLDRVHQGGEHFEIERDGKPIAVLAPEASPRSFTVGDFIALLERLPRPDDLFADDLEAIHASQPIAEAPTDNVGEFGRVPGLVARRPTWP